MVIGSVYLSLISIACVALTAAIGNASTDRDVTYEEVLQIIKDPNVVLIDVRSAEETAETGVIPSAINVPLADLRQALGNMSNEEFLQRYHIDKPTSDGQIVVYCLSGGRSMEALNIALELGYHNVRKYPGSWNEWSEKQEANTAPTVHHYQNLLFTAGVVLIGLLAETFAIK